MHYDRNDIPPKNSFYWIDSDSKYWNQMPHILPFTAKSAGHYRVKRENWKYVARIRPINQLFWVQEGSVEFGYDGKKYIYDKDMVMIYYPMEQHRIRVVSELVDLYWMVIHGPMANQLFRGFEFEREPVKRGSCPVHLFDALMDQIYDDSIPFGLAVAASTAMTIMNYAKTGIPGNQRQMNLVKQAVQLIENTFADPALNINSLAQHLQVNRCVLSRSFAQRMAMSPRGYLVMTRLNQAAELLLSSKMSVLEIGRQSGFSNPVSFIRTFEKHFHTTPTKFRAEQRREYP